MATTTYKLGRDAVTELPGLANCDIIDVTVNVSADQLDVTTYGATALTEPVYMAGLVDVSIDVTCTETTATIGQRGAFDVASLPDTFDAIVLDVKESASPQGKAEFTVTYGLVESGAGD
jgi:hypothetical protein